MTTLQLEQRLTMGLVHSFSRMAHEAVDKTQSLIEQRKRLGVLFEGTSSDSWRVIETLREHVQAEQGQFLSLRLPEFGSEEGEASLPGLLYAALRDAREDREFRINLPMILRHNPRNTPQNSQQHHVLTDLPFISRAILWQRLCDGLIEDEDSNRPTVLVLERFDQASHTAQHDLARLIRFHANHRIRRTFLLTMPWDFLPMLSPELRELVDLDI